MANIIKYVFWDFGDTLVGLKPAILLEFKNIIFQSCGFKIGITELKKAMQDEWNFRGQPAEWDKLKSVNTPKKEHRYYADFFKGTLRRLEIEDCIHAKSIVELANLKISPSSYYVFPDALKIVNKLSKLGINQAIISNGFQAAPKILAESEIRGKFEFEIWSYNHGTIKPEQAIYNLALSKARCHPKEAIFIDDRKSFVKAAHELGMFGIQIDRSKSGNIEWGGDPFPIINNLSATEKYLLSKEPGGKPKNGKETALKENNLQIAV